jgi:large subunit ribosomal protein L25
MSDTVTLKAQVREMRGKGVRHLRRDGVTPIVVYGAKTDPVSLQVETRELVRVLSKAGGTQIISIDVEGEKRPRMTLAKAIQRHVTRLTPLHADFIEVAMDEPILKRVPVLAVGESPAVKRHQGLLNLVMDQIQVRALPASLPPSIDIDVSHLEVHDTVTLADIELPEGVTWADPEDTVVIRVDASRMAAEIEEEDAEEALVDLPEQPVQEEDEEE